jgi:hypothetical protein
MSPEGYQLMPSNELRLRMVFIEEEVRKMLNLGPGETVVVYSFVDPTNGDLIIETRKGAPDAGR